MIKFKSILGKVALVCVSTAVAAVAGEFLVKHFLPQKLYRFPQGLFSQLPNGNYALTPNFSGFSNTVEYETTINTNSLGLRENHDFAEKRDNAVRILVIGDSFTMGVGVNHEDTFIEQLEQSLNSQYDDRNYQLINAGVPGYNTAASLAQLVRLQPKLDPDGVLLAYYVGNDVIDNYDGVSIFVEDGYLRQSTSSSGLIPVNLKSLLQRHSHLYQFLWPLQRSIRDPSYREQQNKAVARLLSIYDTRPRTELDAMWDSTDAQLQRFAKFSQETGVAPGVVIIPEGLQLDTGQWTAAMNASTQPSAGYEPNHPNLRILQYCDALGIPVIDLLGAFVDRDDVANYYHPLDGHWTVTGNAVAAKNLKKFVHTSFGHKFRAANGAEISE